MKKIVKYPFLLYAEFEFSNSYIIRSLSVLPPSNIWDLTWSIASYKVVPSLNSMLLAKTLVDFILVTLYSFKLISNFVPTSTLNLGLSHNMLEFCSIDFALSVNIFLPFLSTMLALQWLVTGNISCQLPNNKPCGFGYVLPNASLLGDNASP